MQYNVKLKYFADKVYKCDNVLDIINEIKIFTDLENIISITKV